MANIALLQKGDLKTSEFTNDNSNNKEGIGIRVSQQTGNLLEKRQDGLYYGVEAPPDLANLYVSTSLGNDSNAGTREKPLKTIGEALRRIPSAPQTFHIWLKEGEQFEMTGFYTRGLSKIAFMPWDIYKTDGRWPLQIPENIHYRGYVAKDFPRPIVNFRTVLNDNVVSRAYIHARQIDATGIHVRVYSAVSGAVDNGSYSGAMHGVFESNEAFVSMHGCILETMTHGVVVPNASPAGTYRNDALLRGDLQLLNTMINLKVPTDGSPYSVLVSNNFTKNVTIIDWYAPGGSLHRNTGPDLEPVAVITQMKANIRVGKEILDVPYNMGSRVTYGCQFNWDIVGNSF